MRDTMVVLVTWFGNAVGGGERSTVELCNTLSRSDPATRIILLYGYSSTAARRLVDAHLHRDVTRYLVRAPLAWWHVISFFCVLYVCIVERPSVVQVNHRATLSESLAARLLHRPVVACLRVIPFRRAQVWQFRLVHHIICISHAVRRSLRRLGWRKQATVIYNGVDVGRFLPSAGRPSVRPACFYMLGRLISWKRPDWFIRAAALVRERCPSAQFYIFGEGPMKPALQALIDRLRLGSAVHLMGWAEPTDEVVEHCGVFVLPSYEEPFGRSLVEAALQGKVVVATRSGAVPELLPAHDLLFARDRLQELADSMAKATVNFGAYRERATGLRLGFAERFNLARVAEGYLAVYRDMRWRREHASQGAASAARTDS